MIDFRNFKEIMAMAEKERKMSLSAYAADRRKDKNRDKKWSELKNFINDDYALAVFRVFSLMNPMMVDVRTNKRVPFNVVFGNDFKELDDGTRSMLAGLMRGGVWSYQFEECVTTVENEVLTTIRLSKLCGGETIPRLP